MLKDDNPDKGTETKDWILRIIFFCTEVLKDDNPDKGTETKLVSTESILLMTDSWKMITPIRGRKPSVFSIWECREDSLLKDDNPDKGTETYTSQDILQEHLS